MEFQVGFLGFPHRDSLFFRFKNKNSYLNLMFLYCNLHMLQACLKCMHCTLKTNLYFLSFKMSANDLYIK